MSGRYWSYGGAGAGRSSADKVVLVRGGSDGGSARANYIGRGREE